MRAGIPLFALLTLLAACSEDKEQPADVGTEDGVGTVEMHILQALLSDGLNQEGTCAPGIFLNGWYGIRNGTDADIRLCSATVQLFQQPEDTRLVCLVYETQLEEASAAPGQTEHSFFFDITGHPTFECYIPFSFTVSPQCGELLLDIVYVPAASDCQTGPRQTVTHLGTFDCLTEQICQ